MKKKNTLFVLIMSLLFAVLLSACAEQGRTIDVGNTGNAVAVSATNVTDSASDEVAVDETEAAEVSVGCDESLYDCTPLDVEVVYPFSIISMPDETFAEYTVTGILEVFAGLAVKDADFSVLDVCAAHPEADDFGDAGWVFAIDQTYVTEDAYIVCLFVSNEVGGGVSAEDDDAYMAGDSSDIEWEGPSIDLLGEFVPHATTFASVMTISEDAAWADPGFVIPWPTHVIGDRQDCPKISGSKVWCTVEIRPGDVILFDADSISTPMGSYLYPSGGYFQNNTTDQIEVSYMYGELVVLDSGDADAMAQVLLKFVVSTNGLTSAAYLGEIAIH